MHTQPSPSEPTELTPVGSPSRKQPRPRPAYTTLPRAGSDITPTAGPCSSNTASRLEYSGTPLTKALVPSMGSTTHVRPDVPGVGASSSPSTASSGKRSATASRRNLSAARSAWVTGVPSALPSTASPDVPNHCRVVVPICRQRSTALSSRAALAAGLAMGEGLTGTAQ